MDIKKDKIVVVIIIISLSIFFFIISALLKNSNINILNQTDTNFSFNKASNEYAQFGSYNMSDLEYNFIFYSVLYTEYPDIKKKPVENIIDYITSTAFNKDMSIYEYIHDKTEQEIILMLEFNQDIIDRKIDLDVSSKVSDYIDKLNQEAEEINCSFDEYISLYYGSKSSELELVPFISKYICYQEYKNNLLLSQCFNCSEEFYEEFYEDNSDSIDKFSFCFLSINLTEFDEDSAKLISSQMDGVYENTHSLDDFKKFSSKIETDYDALFLECNDIRCSDIMSNSQLSGLWSWISDPNISEDTTAIFKSEEKISIVYFVNRIKPENNTVNGYIYSIPVEFYNESITDYSSVKGSNKLNLSNSIISMSWPEEVQSWFKNATIDNSTETITVDETVYVLYYSSQGINEYKSIISAYVYSQKIEEINSTYYPMFANIKYLKEQKK